MVLEFFCAICHESYESSHEICCTDCGHVFHHRCITNWLMRSQTCCVCRTPCTSFDITKIIITSRDVDCEELIEKDPKLKSQLEQAIKNLSGITYMNPVDKYRKELTEIKGWKMQAILDLESELYNKRFENFNLRKALVEAYENLVAKNAVIDEMYKKLHEKSLESQKEIRKSKRLILDKIKLQQLLDASTQRMASISSSSSSTNNNKQYPRESGLPKPKQQREEAASLKIQLNKCELNGGGVSRFRSVVCDNSRSTGAVPKRPGVSRTRLDPQASNLLQYAMNLRKVGFREVFSKKTEIYARLDVANPKIHIISKQQVDELINNFEETNSSIRNEIVKERAPSGDNACL